MRVFASGCAGLAFKVQGSGFRVNTSNQYARCIARNNVCLKWAGVPNLVVSTFCLLKAGNIIYLAAARPPEKEEEEPSGQTNHETS